jgi:NIMA (never in mitosis gene a)-related kinase
MSPEIFKEEEKSPKSDVWAIGCVLYELCFLKAAFNGPTIEEIAKNIVFREPNYQEFIYSEELMGLIKSLLIKEQDKRPSVEDIFRNTFFYMHY